jgi:tungstate transport system permease protein
MQNIVDGVIKAFQLLIQGDPEVIRITLLSLQVSGLATIISLLLGLPVGTFLAW